jgi:hypothetical protein
MLLMEAVLKPTVFGNRLLACSEGLPPLLQLQGMEAPRKITVEIPADLLEKAQRASGAGITRSCPRSRG